MRQHNRQRVLLALLKHGALSRAELMQHTSLSVVTVNAITKDLEESAHIAEVGRTAGQAGRPAGIYALHPHLATLIGADVQPHEIRLLSSDVRGQQRHETIIAVPDPAVLEPLFGSALTALVNDSPHGPVRHVTVSFPAPISQQGEILEPNSLRGITLGSARDTLRACGADLILENDANLHALAERHYGVARDSPNFLVLIQRKSGIGLGLYLDGALYRGAQGRAGELSLARWPDGGRIIPIEDLPDSVRTQALTYLVSAVAVALDVSLLVIKEDTSCASASPPSFLPLAELLPHLRVEASLLGEEGPALGALIASRDRFTHALLTSPPAELAT
ncbi:ROK family protein [Deinococcus sp. KSM4-11]|uniref:ROK family transcriptional regulator n=1 Tax=Deinococcus sp. KSM4-11 TaxID=2568654 RepID=UPI0010A3E2BD|nr:ROK family protein [Deinococcus sp. KSM4-11]THF87212.1 ROK family protein [Deinococcus sp. KSM4-11]